MYSKDILEPIKKNKLIFIFMFIAIISFVLGYSYSKKVRLECKNLDDYPNAINEHVCVTINTLPIMFKIVPNGSKQQTFYVVENNSNKYIVKMTLNTYTQLMIKYKKNKENFQFQIEGKSKKIYDSLRDSSIKIYNNEKNDHLINKTNYEEYFNSVYIDGTDNPSFNIKIPFYLIGSFFLVLTIILLIEYISSVFNLKKAIKKYGKEELEYELNNSSTISYKSIGIYLTPKYIISNLSCFRVIPYQDIYWLYITESKNKGIVIGHHLMVGTKKGRFSIVFVRDNKILEEIIKKIFKINQSILIGNTKENLLKYQKKKTNKI